MISKVKKEIRILGLDDGNFKKSQKNVIVVGVIFRGKESIDGVLSFYVKKDGNDSTLKIIKAIKSTKHRKQLRVIMINGIAFAGFNVINIRKIYKETGIPVIVVIRKMPNLEKIKKALSKFEDGEKRWRIIKMAGKIYKSGKIYYQVAGISFKKAKEVIENSILRGLIPEPLRVAHLIATGISLGESRGRV